MRRADPGADQLHLVASGECSHGIVHADRNGEVSRPQEVRGDEPEQVAGEETHLPGLDGKQEGTIAVTVGGHHRIDGRSALRIDKGLDPLQHLLVDGLGIHRHEGVASSDGRDRGAELGEDSHQEVAAHRGMLPHENPAACEGPLRECRGEAFHVLIASLAILFGDRSIGFGAQHALLVEDAGRKGPGIFLAAHARDVRENGQLVLLQYLPRGGVELYAVPVEGDVAAGHHDGGGRARERVGGEGRCRQPAEVGHRERGVLDCPTDGLEDFPPQPILRHPVRRAGAQVTRDVHAGPPRHLPGFQEPGEEAAGVHIRFEARDVSDQPAKPAGAEDELHRFIRKGLAEGGDDCFLFFHGTAILTEFGPVGYILFVSCYYFPVGEGGAIMRRTRLILIVLACAGMAAYGEDFSATQVRFYSSATQAVAVELSRFGTYTALADGTEGNSVRVLDENGELLWRHRQQAYWAGTFRHAAMLAFAPDESFLIFPAYRTQNDIALVNPKTGDPLSVLTDHADTVDCLALSPDGSRLVSSAGKEVFLWQRAGAVFKVVDRLAGNEASVSSIAIAPEGSLVAMAEYEQMTRRIVLFRVSANRRSPSGNWRTRRTISATSTGRPHSPRTGAGLPRATRTA